MLTLLILSGGSDEADADIILDFWWSQVSELNELTSSAERAYELSRGRAQGPPK